MTTRIVERHALTLNVKLVVTDCAACGIVFAMPEDHIQSLRKTGNTFYCPNGHTMHYQKSPSKEVESLKQQLKWANNRADGANRRAAAERSLSATKGVVTKMKRRAAAGVCPCCNRHFTQLLRHMQTKHPEFVEEARDA